ncbi:MAG: hypothetical protein V3U67_01375 [Gemmatimonadota bacterium]
MGPHHDQPVGKARIDLAQITRHQICATLLAALRHEGLGVRDLFEGRQEPASWFFRCLAFDQSELDIMESGAIESLHAPSAMVELLLDEVALAGANLGADGIATYLAISGPYQEEADPLLGALPEAPLGLDLQFHPESLLGYLNLDIAPPTLWLDEREADPQANERLAGMLAEMAQDIGTDSDTVEVHIEGALDATEGWADTSRVRPAGVSIHFTFEIPLPGVNERELGHHFASSARTASAALERMRGVFERPT